MLRETSITSAMIFLIVGCACRQDIPQPAEQDLSRLSASDGQPGPSSGLGALLDRGAGDVDPGTGVVTCNTGDSDHWPSYDLPLVIELEVPEVPRSRQRGLPAPSTR
jgi:hypothetical protein